MGAVILIAAKNPGGLPEQPQTEVQKPAPALRLFYLAAAVSLTVSALVYFGFSWRWPLVGDASIMHYLAFLIERGWAPYRQLEDQQFPGAYLVELAAMHVFGMGGLAWRLFDFTVLIAASAAFFAISRYLRAPSSSHSAGRDRLSAPAVPASWLDSRIFAGIFSSSLFILAHGRDGLVQGGQRDLTIAVCLITATVFLIRSVRRQSIWSPVLFGLLSGIAFTIKPTSLPLTTVQLVLAALAARAMPQTALRSISPARLLFSGALGFAVAPIIATAFLLREHALAAFIADMRDIIPYYASLGHRSLDFALVQSLSTFHPLILAWLAVLALRSRHIPWTRDWERNILLAGVAFGVFNCLIQQRALPYYRYPLLAFLLPLMACDFTGVLSTTPAVMRPEPWTRAAKGFAILGLTIGSFFLAPRSALLIHRYRWWQTDFITSLEQNLDTLGGAALSRHIQCIDSISGCDTVLYRMRLEPASGILGDYLLFGRDTVPIVRQSRQQLANDLIASPPRVIVVSSRLFLDTSDDFAKLNRWADFENFLITRYTLATEWRPTRPALWWAHPETPASYRIYVLRTPLPPPS